MNFKLAVLSLLTIILAVVIMGTIALMSRTRTLAPVTTEAAEEPMMQPDPKNYGEMGPSFTYATPMPGNPNATPINGNGEMMGTHATYSQ